MYAERVSDPYRLRGKWPEPTTCPECGAIFHDGHWQWGEEKERAEEHLCPACQRVRDRVPAGLLTVSGEFFVAHRQEILKLIRNVESKAKAEHPLERIMSLDEHADSAVISLTDLHLAHGIGQALHHAYQGDLDSGYTDEDDLLRITWTR